MTLQQLKYAVAVAEAGSITEAAKRLYLSQPSLSGAIRELETETGTRLFLRSRAGVTLTKDGMEFLGYARQVLQQMELLEDKYITALPPKTKFGVSAQHYTFTENAFVDLVRQFGQDRYEFFFHESGTHQILEDVRNRISDLGVLYLCEANETVLRRLMEDYGLQFCPLFDAKPHVFLQKHHPLAGSASLTLRDLREYPRLKFVQGEYEASYFSEELFSTVPAEKEIHINDRGAIVHFMECLNAYTISSGIYLQGDEIVSVPLAEKERMQIGYVLPKKQALSELGERYIRELRKYDPNTTP